MWNSLTKKRNTALWYNVACGVTTIVVIWYAVNLKLDWTFAGVYLGSLCGAALTSKHIAIKGANNVGNTGQDIEYQAGAIPAAAGNCCRTGGSSLYGGAGKGSNDPDQLSD